MSYIKQKYSLPLSTPFSKLEKILSKEDYEMFMQAMKYPNGMPDNQTPKYNHDTKSFTFRKK
jgi:hypothetical protein